MTRGLKTIGPPCVLGERETMHPVEGSCGPYIRAMCARRSASLAVAGRGCYRGYWAGGPPCSQPSPPHNGPLPVCTLSYWTPLPAAVWHLDSTWEGFVPLKLQCKKKVNMAGMPAWVQGKIQELVCGFGLECRQ